MSSFHDEHPESYVATTLKDARRDVFPGFPTMTHISGKDRLYFSDRETGDRVEPVVKVYFEDLSPLMYETLYQMVQVAAFRSHQDGLLVAPLNERGHVCVLVLDVDDGNVPMHEMVAFGRLVQTTFSVHLSIATSFVLAGRVTPEGKTKYHLFFPEVVVFDTSLWFVVNSIVRRLLKPLGLSIVVDTAPMSGRCIRMHSTDREAGLYRGAGVYRVVAMYNAAYEAVDLMTVPIANMLTSVRPCQAVLKQWMMNPSSAKIKTQIARDLYKALGGVGIDEGLIDFAVDGMRRLELLATDRHAGTWALVDVKARCQTCDDHLRCRLLCRFYEERATEEVDGLPTTRTTTIAYRWLLCTACDSDIVALPSLRGVDVVRGAPLARYIRLDLSPDYQIGKLSLDCRNVRHVYDLPLEAFYANGFQHFHFDETIPVNAVERRVSGASVSVSQLVHLMSADRTHKLTESNIHLTVAMCSVDDDQLPRLSVGMQYADAHFMVPHVSEDTHHCIFVQAPCGAGKTEWVMRDHIARGRRVLVVAPRIALTSDLATRIRDAVPDKIVLNYKTANAEARSRPRDHADVLVVTPESLPRFVCRGPAGAYDFGADVVVIDEFCSVIKTLYESSTTAQNRVDIQRALVAAIALSSTSVLMDKDIGLGERLFLASVIAYMRVMPWPLRNILEPNVAPPVHVTTIKMEDAVKRKLVVWPKLVDMYKNIQDELDVGKNVAVFFAKREDAYQMSEYFKETTAVKLVTGSTDESSKREFSSNPNEVLQMLSVQLLIYTMTLNIGVSIDRYPFHSVYVVPGKHLTFRDLLQAEARVRSIVGQHARLRVTNTFLGDLSGSKTSLLNMPTIGSAIAVKQCLIAGSTTIRVEHGLLEHTQIDGSCSLTESFLNVVNIATQAIHEHECDLQYAVLEQWQADHAVDVEFMDDGAEDSDMMHDLRLSKSSGRVQNTQDDAMNDDDDALSAMTKRRKIHGCLPTAMPDVIDELGKCLPFVKWAKSHGKPTCENWAVISSIFSRTSATVEAERVTASAAHGGVSVLQSSDIACALFTIAVVNIGGCDAIFTGEPAAPQYVDARVTSPFDGRTQISADQLFERISAAGPLKKSQQPFACRKHLLRSSTHPYVDDEHNKFKSRLKFCISHARMLLGGKIALQDPKKMIFAARAQVRWPVFEDVDIEGNPWVF